MSNDKRTIPTPVSGKRKFPEDTRTTKEVMRDFYERGFC